MPTGNIYLSRCSVDEWNNGEQGEVFKCFNTLKYVARFWGLNFTELSQIINLGVYIFEYLGRGGAVREGSSSGRHTPHMV